MTPRLHLPIVFQLVFSGQASVPRRSEDSSGSVRNSRPVPSSACFWWLRMFWRYSKPCAHTRPPTLFSWLVKQRPYGIGHAPAPKGKPIQNPNGPDWSLCVVFLLRNVPPPAGLASLCGPKVPSIASRSLRTQSWSNRSALHGRTGLPPHPSHLPASWASRSGIQGCSGTLSHAPMPCPANRLLRPPPSWASLPSNRKIRTTLGSGSFGRSIGGIVQPGTQGWAKQSTDEK